MIIENRNKKAPKVPDYYKLEPGTIVQLSDSKGPILLVLENGEGVLLKWGGHHNDCFILSDGTIPANHPVYQVHGKMKGVIVE